MISGVNKQILDRLGVLDAVPEYPSNEWDEALGSLDEHKRRRAALSLIGKIWNAHPGLGPSPVLEILYTDEEERKLYDSYRDHIVHSLQVYILGLDILHGLPDLRRQLEGTSGFAALKRRWAIASLAHDQGYIFTSRPEGKTPESLRRLLQNPLLGIHGAERGWIEDFDRYHKFVPGQIDYLQNLLSFDGHDVLTELEKRVPISVLGPTLTPLTAFYEFSLRTGFFSHDHGIVSALLLEQLHRRLRVLLGSVDWESVPRRHHDNLRAMHKHLETAFPDVTEAAVAMALHNVNSSLRREHLDQAQALHQLNISHFRLTLADTPLAWFLAFCDVLQCWNRPVIVQKADADPNSIEPEGVCISYDRAHMWLSFSNEETELKAARPSPYWVMRRQLAAQLNEGDLAFLLEGQGPEATVVTGPNESGSTAHSKVTDTRNYAIMGELSSTTITKDELDFRVKSQPRKYPDHKPVCVLYTGGSVGMVPKDPSDPKSPLETEKLHRVIPYLTNLSRLEFDVDFYETPHPLDSSNILPRDWVEIGNLITALYRYYQGFVVLHGTDTMTYTAAALSFMFSNLRKPIILTGAERPISEPETDAEHNLMRALRLAAPSTLENDGVPEVCIFFGNRLIRGNRAKKTHALDFNGFDSPNSPHLGKVEDKISINWRYVRDAVLKRRTAEMEFDPRLDERVAIYEIFPGLASCIEPLKYMLLESTAVQGLILKTYGTGNAPSNPEEFLQILRTAIWEKGKIIINLTHCQTGEVEVRLFETNARLFEAGVVNGGDMTSEAAYAKLMVLMGCHTRLDVKGNVTYDYDAIKKQIQRDMRGELRLSAHTLVYPDATNDVISFGPRPFFGASKDLGIPIDDQVNHAYIRVANLVAHAKQGARVKIAVCINLPADASSDITRGESKHVIAVVERIWEGVPLTFNVDATERVKRFVERNAQLSMQLVPIESMTFTVETFELSVFTENLKG
jgi:L-asparaginase